MAAINTPLTERATRAMNDVAKLAWERVTADEAERIEELVTGALHDLRAALDQIESLAVPEHDVPYMDRVIAIQRVLREAGLGV